MTAQNIATHDVVSVDDLKLLAGARGPCLTMVVLLPNPAEIKVRLKNAIRAAQNALGGRDADDGFLQPVKSLADTLETERNWANALIVLRSPDLWRYYWLHGQWKEAVTVADRFQVRQLFALIAREQRFHLLALSQKHVRLFHCTQHNAEEAGLSKHAPQNLHVWMKTRLAEPVECRSIGRIDEGRRVRYEYGSRARG